MKNKHRIKQGLSLLLAGALTFTNVGAALPAFAEDAPATPETASAATPETSEAMPPLHRFRCPRLRVNPPAAWAKTSSAVTQVSACRAW